jgi:LexA-binding, inner membrane-associated putative hydrolase
MLKYIFDSITAFGRFEFGVIKLPFTPFHMGAALIVKPGLNRNFSVITFGLAQVAMDIEPGIGMLTGADVLHGPTHTILGALVIAYLVMLIAPSVCNYLQNRWNKEVIHYKLPWLVQSAALPKSAVIFGAFFGTLSHVALDSLMHHDIQPLMPFSKANPLLGLIAHDKVYQLCAIAGVLGAVIWLVMKWVGRSR